jgi:hypothetical protein
MEGRIVLSKKHQSPPPFFGEFAVIAVALSLLLAGCDILTKLGIIPGEEDDGSEKSVPITFTSVIGDDDEDDATARLLLTFSADISGLDVDDITLYAGETGAKKEELESGGEGAYTLTLSGVRAAGEIAVGAAKSGYSISPVSRNVRTRASKASIKANFGVTAPGAEGVAQTFTALHEFIQAGGLDKQSGVIKLGDWIDLEGGLTVAAYGSGNNTGGFSHDAKKAVEAVKRQGQPWGTLCRLIVVGINSFHSGQGAYTVMVNDNTPHVVFQFQNIPVRRRMNAASTDGGYAVSEMRTYLTENFLAGLNKAGVPDEVLWAPERVLSVGIKRTGNAAIKDKLWLPTEREMFQDGKNPFDGPYASDGETAENQARLEYYTDNTSRAKAWCGNIFYYPDMEDGDSYWMSSADYSRTSSFCTVGRGETNHGGLDIAGVAPAFCVN